MQRWFSIRVEDKLYSLLERTAVNTSQHPLNLIAQRLTTSPTTEEESDEPGPQSVPSELVNQRQLPVTTASGPAVVHALVLGITDHWQ